MNEKKTIYYARTYRRLKGNAREFILYLILFILPSIFLFCLFLPDITRTVMDLAGKVLRDVSPDMELVLYRDRFLMAGDITYLGMPTVKPGMWHIWGNIGMALIAILIMGTGKRRKRPLSVFGILVCCFHLVNCIYFLFLADEFPYTITVFSDLYVKQQIGIWITFLALSGLVTGYLGARRFRYKVLALFSVTTYSLVFGTLRYIVFLFILHKYSVLYMTLMYFVFGPAFDFLYFVGIYSVFANKMVKEYDAGNGEWIWL